MHLHLVRVWVQIEGASRGPFLFVDPESTSVKHQFHMNCVYPSPSNSHLQDYYIFSRESL